MRPNRVGSMERVRIGVRRVIRFSRATDKVISSLQNISAGLLIIPAIVWSDIGNSDIIWIAGFSSGIAPDVDWIRYFSSTIY